MTLNFDEFNSLPQQVAENKKNIEELISNVEEILDLDVPALAEEVESLGATVDDLVTDKQDTLVSGENIKTINNESLLGSGNIDIQGGGGGLTEIVTDDIYFSTFFNTYPDGVYILSATAQNKQITVHLGVDDLDTETLPLMNPNQKMLMFVNNEYQNNAHSSMIKWKGITVINGGGANSVYDIRQRTTNANIHLFNVVANLPATIQDLNMTKFETIFGNLDIPQFLEFYQPENNQNNKYMLMPDYQQNFDITNGTGNVLFSLEYGDASSSIVLVKPFVNQWSDAQCCTFTIYHGSEIIVITYDYTNEQLLDNSSFSLYDINRITGAHNVTFGFAGVPSTTVSSYLKGIIGFQFISGNTTPISTLEDLVLHLYYNCNQKEIIANGNASAVVNGNNVFYNVLSVKITNYDENTGDFKLNVKVIDRDDAYMWDYTEIKTFECNLNINDAMTYMSLTDDVYTHMG